MREQAGRENETQVMYWQNGRNQESLGHACIYSVCSCLLYCNQTNSVPLQTDSKCKFSIKSWGLQCLFSNTSFFVLLYNVGNYSSALNFPPINCCRNSMKPEFVFFLFSFIPPINVWVSMWSIISKFTSTCLPEKKLTNIRCYVLLVTRYCSYLQIKCFWWKRVVPAALRQWPDPVFSLLLTICYASALAEALWSKAFSCCPSYSWVFSSPTPWQKILQMCRNYCFGAKDQRTGFSWSAVKACNLLKRNSVMI